VLREGCLCIFDGYERWEFPEACGRLPKRVGIELTNRETNSGLATQKERLYQINSLNQRILSLLLTHTRRQAGIGIYKESWSQRQKS